MPFITKQLLEVYQAHEDYLLKEQEVMLEISKICSICADLPREELRDLLIEIKYRFTTGVFSDPFSKIMLAWVIDLLQTTK